MKAQFLDLAGARATYDGTQLRSLFAYLDHGLLGDSIVAWIGPCEISFEHMVDGEDLRESAAIRGSRMVHFIVEKFGASLSEMVVVQRLLASIVADVVRAKQGDQPWFAVRRDGDDVFLKLPDAEGKLSISIASVSPVSGLVHFAVNVSNEGTPVKTAALEDIRFAGREFADQILSLFASEMDSVQTATMKVKWLT